ncbi:MAG TPA: hypothetical protein VJ723_13345 [Candidatus Angelobacter sp.]|nr:hypothetical protein [Candidatus Angelobacter sp.]
MATNLLSDQLPLSKLIHNIRLQIMALFLLGLVGVAYCGFTTYRLAAIKEAVLKHVTADMDQAQRSEALYLIEMNQRALADFLIAPGVQQIEPNKYHIDRMSESHADQTLKNLVAMEDQWYSEVAAPLEAQRRSMGPDRAGFDDLVARYHEATVNNSLDLKTSVLWGTNNLEYLESVDQFAQYASHVRAIEYLVVALLGVLCCFFAVGILTTLQRLKVVAAELLPKADAAVA